MKKLLFVLLFSACAFVSAQAQAVLQVANAIKAASSAPSGSCSPANVIRNYNGVLYTCQSGSWAIASGSSTPEISAAVNSAIAGSITVFRYVSTGSFTLPASLTGSYFVAGTAATAQADFLIKKNGSTFCTARFAAAGTTASYTSCASATSIAAGDLITIIAPATPDATLADIAISLKGSN